MPEKVVWALKEERRGTVTDWWFEPADGWDLYSHQMLSVEDMFSLDYNY